MADIINFEEYKNNLLTIESITEELYEFCRLDVESNIRQLLEYLVLPKNNGKLDFAVHDAINKLIVNNFSEHSKEDILKAIENGSIIYLYQAYSDCIHEVLKAFV